MVEIIRNDVNHTWAHSGIITAGNLIFVNYCVGNPDQDIEGQINGAIDHLEERLKSIGETLDCLVKVDCLFKDIWQIPVMEKVFHERFKGNYPTRKSIQTAFAHNGGVHGLLFQMDAIGVRD